MHPYAMIRHAACLLGILSASCAAHECREITQREFRVIRVIDGDTFRIQYDGEPTSVRLLGIDAPERGKPGAAEATAYVRQLIDGRVVRLSFGAKRKRDNFGRLLATVTVGGRDVAEGLNQKGLADEHQQ